VLGLPISHQLKTADLEGSLDVVTMWDVIEHLHQPAETLTMVRQLLKPGGWLIVSTPNPASLDARLFRGHWKGLDVPRHTVVLDKRAMRRLLADSGFRLARVYSFYGRHTVFALSLQLWLKCRYPSIAKHPLTDRVLFLAVWRWLTLPFFLLVEALGYGSILTYVAQPEQPSSR
jgi:SAM-dependent methyltransferase